MRPSLLLAALALFLSACSTSAGAGGHNGWAAGRSATRSEPAPASRPVTQRTARPARPSPRFEAPPASTASGLVIPVVGIGSDRLRDTFTSPRSGGRTHHAIDIAAPTGTPIVAVTDGVISQKHWNALGGRTLYLTSADGQFDFYYAHMDSYADGIEIGTRVMQGQTIGTVGATGNAQGPHLHFQVLDKRGGGRGAPVNPFDLLRASEWVRAD